MLRFSLIFTALSGFLAVALGAFGAHALRGTLTPELLAVWHTGVLYQFFHTLALLGTVCLSQWLHPQWQRRSMVFFMLGIVLFSGSLYALVLVGLGKLGIITPIGGLCFLLGWLCLGIGIKK
ncbi:DUF423 domain-containing protein [Pelistega europaea]|uniref:DUF423 domain-containing protein n=1 Tax=Pelistega europaea TaxID=106147 RepID=A0A7Y4L9H4_9BURK|nr:DUF423 domain-containing protein [Pelistega europaea]NOL49465.1 DUF423 domain-containing protein [Pelistega europaea]